MQYNLANPLDLAKFQARVAKAVGSNAVVDLTEKKARTVAQNRYLHLLVGVVAMETGVSLEYAKAEYFKRLVNGEIFTFRSEDPILHRTTERLRSINDVEAETLTKAIDKFKMWGREQGFTMPDSEDVYLLQLIEVEMSKNRWL